jgi:hypothetical protein
MEQEISSPYFFVVDSRRFCMAVLSYGEKDENMKSLLVSYHGCNKGAGLTDENKLKNTKHYLTFFDKVRHAHGCQTMIIGGDFNIKYSAIQSDCNTLLEGLDLKVMRYDLEYVPVNERTESHYGHHRAQDPNATRSGRRKEKVDTLIHSNSISVVEGSIVVDKDIPAEIMDHHPILVTLRLPNEAEVEQKQMKKERQEKQEKQEKSDEKYSNPNQDDLSNQMSRVRLDDKATKEQMTHQNPGDKKTSQS